MYRELGEIGRLPDPLDPPTLMFRETLLARPLVQRLAGPDASHERLVIAASLALKEAIASIPVERDRYIAQAMFAMTDEYRGQLVETRRDRLFRDHGISINVYADRRPHVLQHMMVTLADASRREASLVNQQRGVRAAKHEEIGWDLEELLGMGDYAAEIYFACLASLFNVQFAKRVDPPWYASPRRGDAEDALSRRAFHAFIDYYVCAFRFEGDFEEQVAHLVTSSALTELAFLSRTIDAYGPASTPDDRLLFAAHHIPVKIDYNGGPIEGIYEGLWLPWYDESHVAGRRTPIPATDRLSAIAAKTGAFVQLLSKQTDYSRPSLTMARSVTHKSLAYYYDCAEYEPVLDGKPMRFHADAFFDGPGLALASSELVWYD